MSLALISFLIILATILILSKKDLGILLTVGSVILALVNWINPFSAILSVLMDFSIIFLMISVSLIPILGGIMEESGMMMELIKKMKVSRKLSLMLAPALFGLLPVPGGALLSAPIVDQIDKDMKNEQKIAINVWFRHVFLLIYPISPAILVASYLAKISVYLIIVALLLPFVFMVFLGHFLFLRKISPIETIERRNLKVVIRNLIPLLTAPLIDFFGRIFFGNVLIPEIFLMIGLIISILLAKKLSSFSWSEIYSTMKEMKIWKFSLLIFGMFLFLEVFLRSDIPNDLSQLNFSFYLIILMSFFLGFATGRIQLPISILIPIYLTQHALISMPLLDFVLMYWAVYMGYIITPLHPCLSYSINYFKNDYKKVLKVMLIPIITCLGLIMLIQALTSIF